MPKVTLDLIYNKLVSLEDRIESLEVRMGGLETRIDGLETKMETGFRILEYRMGKLESRMENIESRMGRLEAEIGLVMRDQEALGNNFKGLEVLLGDVSSVVVSQDEFKTLISQNDLKYHKIS